MKENDKTEMLDIRTENDVLVVSFRQASIGGMGEIEDIARALRSVVQDPNSRKMIIDFSGVSFFASSMLGLLVDIWRRMKEGGGTLLISGINPQLTRVFRITHLDKLFEFYEDSQAAVSALRTS